MPMYQSYTKTPSSFKSFLHPELSYVTNGWDLTTRDIHHCYEQRWDMEILNI
jgi:hypothetical protein